MTGTFGDAALAAVRALTREQADVLAARIAGGASDSAVLDAVPLAAYRDAAGQVLAAIRVAGTAPGNAAAHLRALAEGYAAGRAAQHVEVVWSGPSSAAVPIRATAQVLADLIGEASRNLILMTYSATPQPSITQALAAASSRHVAATVVVETLAGAGGALAGDEPAASFAGIPGVQVWHWPVARRPEQSSKMHAKLAVADAKVLLVTSANLTQSGIAKNIEAGLLVRGGPAPIRAVEHVRQLQATGSLQRLL